MSAWCFACAWIATSSSLSSLMGFELTGSPLLSYSGSGMSVLRFPSCFKRSMIRGSKNLMPIQTPAADTTPSESRSKPLSLAISFLVCCCTVSVGFR